MDVDNFILIKRILSFTDKLDFYHVFILKRNKDNNGEKTKQIASFFIDSYESLLSKYKAITAICMAENARAYITVNKKNYKKVAFALLKKTTDMIFNEEYKTLKNINDSVIHSTNSTDDKKWVIDVDELPIDFDYESLISDLRSLQQETKKEPLIELFPTVNGIHIITRPFNLSKFKNKYNITVQKNSFTVLYYKNTK